MLQCKVEVSSNNPPCQRFLHQIMQEFARIWRQQNTNIDQPVFIDKFTQISIYSLQVGHLLVTFHTSNLLLRNEKLIWTYCFNLF